MNENMENMINDEDLEQVTGGDALSGFVVIGNNVFSNHVDKYSGKIGSYYYLVSDDKTEWFYGKLCDSYELEYAAYTIRTHVFRVTIYNGTAVKGTKQFCGDDYSMFTQRGVLRAPTLD